MNTERRRDSPARVLVVEDDPLIRVAVQAFLEGAGYEAVVVEGPAQALALEPAALNAVALVLTDIVMPGMDGAGLVEALSARRPGLRALYMSGYPPEVLVADGRLPPGRPTLTKPFSEAELIAKVAALIAVAPPP